MSVKYTCAFHCRKLLEHSRIFYFQNGGGTRKSIWEVRTGPARNLDRRVEILFPVLDDEIKEKVKHILTVELSDNMKAHVLKSNGIYEKIDKRGKARVSSQAQFCKEAIAAVPKPERVYTERVFILRNRWRQR